MAAAKTINMYYKYIIPVSLVDEDWELSSLSSSNIGMGMDPLSNRSAQEPPPATTSGSIVEMCWKIRYQLTVSYNTEKTQQEYPMAH